MTGLLGLRRARLAWIAVLYAALTITVLAVPAIVAQRRDAPSHLTKREVGTPEAAPPSPGRQR